MAEKRIACKYPGVYYAIVPTVGGRGGTEKKFYIRYRRGGRTSPQINELLGRESEGWTEKRASDERNRRKCGQSQSNVERRQAAAESHAEQQAAQAASLTYESVWLAYREHNANKTSIKNDVSLTHLHLGDLLGRAVSSLTTSDIVNLRRQVEQKDLSPQTVKHVLGLVRRVLRFGVKQGLCRMPENLVFDMPQVDNEKTEAMTAEQFAAYLAAIDEEPDQDAAAVLRLALTTGMRKSAILSLRWDDIDFERGFITLRGENAKSGRTSHLPLNDATARILRNIVRQGEFVFPGKFGGHRESITRIARRVRDKAGLKDFRPMHGLRHTFASTLASKGVDLYTLQTLLTHGSPAMTQRYAHLSDDYLRKVANMANDLAGTNDARENN